MITHRGLVPADRPAMQALLESLDAFTDDERAVALELVDARLNRPDLDEYRFILGVSDAGTKNERVAGYLCYGRTPMTQSTYDLYWLATSPDFVRAGVARTLCAAMEDEITREGGGLVRVETGSREGHNAAAHFYDALGFERSAVIQGFYAPDDDLLIFTKRITSGKERSFDALDGAALYDAAFGYRDYGAERDFLLACARKFGEREVKRVLAWPAGAGRHLWAFADVGILGIGADPSKTMTAYARRMAPALAGPEITFVKAELDDKPRVPRALLPVDLSFVPLSGIHQLTTPKAMEKHLKIAASLLAPGGVHVVEATHPADVTPSGVNHTEWTELKGEHVVDARFRMHVEKMTPERVLPVTLEVQCTTKGNGGERKEPSTLKQENEWFIPDLEGWRAIVANVPDLELVAALGDFSAEVPFEHQSAWRLILVLKRV